MGGNKEAQLARVCACVFMRKCMCAYVHLGGGRGRGGTKLDGLALTGSRLAAGDGRAAVGAIGGGRGVMEGALSVGREGERSGGGREGGRAQASAAAATAGQKLEQPVMLPTGRVESLAKRLAVKALVLPTVGLEAGTGERERRRMSGGGEDRGVERGADSVRVPVAAVGLSALGWRRGSQRGTGRADDVAATINWGASMSFRLASPEERLLVGEIERVPREEPRTRESMAEP